MASCFGTSIVSGWHARSLSWALPFVRWHYIILSLDDVIFMCSVCFMRASFASQQLLNKVELAVGFNFLNTKLIATVKHLVVIPRI